MWQKKGSVRCVCITGGTKGVLPTELCYTHTHYYTLSFCGHTKSTQKYNIDKEIEKCNLCICNSVEEKQLKEGWKSVIVHNSREEEILEEIKKVVHP